MKEQEHNVDTAVSSTTDDAGTTTGFSVRMAAVHAVEHSLEHKEVSKREKRSNGMLIESVRANDVGFVVSGLEELTGAELPVRSYLMTKY